MSHTSKSQNIENMNEAEKRRQAGQEASSAYADSAKQHASDALHQGKEAAAAKEMQMSGSVDKHTEAAKASGKESTSTIGGAISSLAEKAKGFISGTPSNTETDLQSAQQSKENAEKSAHEAYGHIKDAADKGKQSVSEMSAAAKSEREAAENAMESSMDNAKKQAKEMFHGQTQATHGSQSGHSGTESSETEKAKYHGQEAARHAREATTGAASGGSTKSE